MAEFDAVVVGELNVDLILQDVSSFPEMGTEKIAKDMALTMGSASAILASNLAHLGAKVGFIGKLGQDPFGEIILDTLKDHGVDCGGIQRDETARTGVTVSMTFPSNYAMVTYMGAMESFSLHDIDFSYLSKGRHLHLSSFYLQPGLRPGCAELFRQAKEAHLTTSFDPGWDPQEEWKADIQEVLKLVDVFLPNEQEALNISSSRTVREALDQMDRTCQVVIIKQGEQGAIGRINGETIKIRAFEVESVDTTGAGDSFNAGFLFEWLRDSEIRQCLKAGNACGALATTKMGGSTASPSKKELDEFLASKTDEIFVH
ncbi:MAG: carbohydrate kinase family protein [Fidelibacterota bacterium]|nr:MAG: carbohydrate kinase family protein [Candidatus Neomarinimicrobiota bacterium]